MKHVIGVAQMLDTAAAELKMNTARQLVVEWIEQILTDKNWNGTDLARAAELAPSTILRLLNDPKHHFVPSMRTLQKISEGVLRPIPDALIKLIAKGEEDEGTMMSRRAIAAQRFLSTVPVKHVSALPESLRRNTTPREEQRVPVPPQYEGDQTIFAFYMPDSAMEPIIRSGSLAYATKHRDASAGDLVLITDKQGKSRVRSLMEIDEIGLKLSKSVPAKEDEVVPFDDLDDIAVIVAILR
jgi:transcriptional regulator with XRE-family HTH domain